jgi:hypothetical protein
MRLRLTLAAALLAAECHGARCLTRLDPRALKEFERYVAEVIAERPRRLNAVELSWIPEAARTPAAGELRAGRIVRRAVDLQARNARLDDWDAAMIHWIGAVRIEGAAIEDVRAVLQDYGRYPAIYAPLIHQCRAQPAAGSGGAAYDVTFGLQNVYRVASFFPQHYAFQVKSRSDYAERSTPAGRLLTAHWRASQIRESESGSPGKDDLMEEHHDHGVLWGLDTFWLARQQGPDLYLEFETITLARSVKNFRCRIGIVPVPKRLVATVMETFPAESLEVMLSGTKRECELRVSERRSAERWRK